MPASRFVAKAGTQLDLFNRHLQRQPSTAVHPSDPDVDDLRSDLPRAATASANVQANKLGTLEGVFVPVFLSIWGVIVFLRFPWIVGQAGLIGTLVLFSLSYLLTTSTTLSLSAISTNGQVRGGGAYYLISRCLGPEFGGSIGTVFFLGTVLTGAMNLLGFVEPLLASFGEKNGAMLQVLPEGRWWQLLYASVASVICLGLCLIGSSVVARASVFLAVILLVSTISVMGSLGLQRPFDIIGVGVSFPGWNLDTLTSNLAPSFTVELGVKQSFYSVFSIVFPACTGILAGASMSGDLRAPSRSIPRGTIGALSFTYVSYICLAILVAGSVDRQTLHSDLSILQDVAVVPSLVAVGVAATSFFSALGSMIGAAKILQAIGTDDLLPLVSVFERGTQHTNEPVRGILFTFGLMQTVLLFVTDINEIAPFVTMFSLLTFGVLNLACFLLRAAGSPNFRPTFYYFNWRTALFGFVGCIGVMFVVDDINAMYSCVLGSILFGIIHYYAPPKSWGDVTQSLIYHQCRKYLLRLDLRKEHVKFWRPQVMVLVQDPRQDLRLIKFLNDLKKGGLFVLGHVLKGDFNSRLAEYKRQLPAWLRYADIAEVKAFVQLTIAPSERIGAQNLMLSSGLGGMKPNIVVLPFLDSARRSPDFLNSSDDELDPVGGAATVWTRPNDKPIVTDDVKALEQDPLIADLPTSVDLEEGISPTDFVGIIEDALGVNKAVAVARGFADLEEDLAISHPGGHGNNRSKRQRLTTYAAEEYRRLSMFFSSRFRPTEFDSLEESAGLLSEHTPSASATDTSSSSDSTDTSEIKYIDLWPIQMAQTGLAKSAYTFDSYTLVLQLGTILHMVPHWKEKYKLRAVVFVENEDEADEERRRVSVLLAGLRIQAELKMVWLRPRYGRSDSEEYERVCRRLHLHMHTTSPATPKKAATDEAGCSETAKDSENVVKRRSTLIATRLSREYVSGFDFDAEQESVAQAMEESALDMADSPTRTVRSVFDTLPTHTQHVVLNQLLHAHSGSDTTAVILMTLPAPEPGAGRKRDASLRYLDELDTLTKGLPPTFMVHGKGLTVTMSL
ncbi:amino acid permease-domain-containing protein [Gaertneriomyces semiglobifer]|nr:amino acid permease-domain-containing protein [Gaertneriomyces semiglobifer]